MAEWKFAEFAHGGDYNPDQWRHIPGIFEEDLRLMKLAGCNMMTVGIFSWAALEPEEGRYDFDWLQNVIDKLWENGVSVLLATPSGARPAWMSQKYPEVLRAEANRLRNLHGRRHNHCYTSPIYREFTRKINAALAKRFGQHPAVAGWHISNEYGGECHCPLCQAAFRDFLRAKYGTLEALNRAWWTGFWAKTYTDWDQLESPSPRGEDAVHGLKLDWMRFVTRQTVDFMRAEIAPIREICPDLPVTTNMMGAYKGLDYFRFRDDVDLASFDSYPTWGSGDDAEVALNAAFNYDLTRSIKRKPWLLMESTPSMTNWQEVCKPKRPGMHLLSSLQAVAHGADSVQYFQWRQSRGACEKLHGAVVAHVGAENTRVFRDVAGVGEHLKKLKPLLHSEIKAEAALIFDWNNRWALDEAKGPTANKRFDEIALDHYAALKALGINVDVVDEEQSFDGYKLIVAPTMYMVKPGVAERLEKFVAGGGRLALTYFSGIADENDLCFLGGFPGPLRKLAGVWAEEIDALYPGQQNGILFPDGTRYDCDYLCDLIHAESAEVLAAYESDFYAGRPAFTRNRLGNGAAYYIAAHTGRDFLTERYGEISREAGIAPLGAAPHGVQLTLRELDGRKYLFALNFTAEAKVAVLPNGRDLLSGEALGGAVEIPPVNFKIIACD